MRTLVARRILVPALLLGCTCLLALASNRGAQEPATKSNPQQDPYSEQLTHSYNFPFEKGNISLPGNGAVEGGVFLRAEDFPDAEYCGHCHEEAYHQWRQSLHSNAFRTPFYRTSVNILIQTKGIEFARHCDSC